jgi:hypothetical protein
LSRVSFTSPTSTVGLQWLNFWLLEVLLRCVNDGVTTMKPGHQTTGNACVIWSDESDVPYIRKSLCLEDTQGSLQSGMHACFQQWNRGSSLMVCATMLWYCKEIHGQVG